MGRKFLSALVVVAALSGCKELTSNAPGSSGATQASITYSVQLKWDANRETSVNSPGGGYRIYYTPTSGAELSSGKTVDVPFSGTATPTQTTVTGLAAGQYYFQVVAYSSITPPGATAGSGSASTASTEATITVP